MARVPREYIDQSAYDTPQKLMLCGWAGAECTASLLLELDQGNFALPHGSEVVMVSVCPPERLKRLVRSLDLQRVSVSHVRRDPLKLRELRHVDMAKFKCAVVLCDERWIDPDAASQPQEEANGAGPADDSLIMHRLDSLVMQTTLNIRKALVDKGLSPINIITQKMSSLGETRFDDLTRMPLGVSMNFPSFAARALAYVAYNPTALLLHLRLGETTAGAMLRTIVDASEYSAEGERVSYLALMGRAQQQGHLLCGYYQLPQTFDQRIRTNMDTDAAERARERVWNHGDGRLKFIVLRKMHG